MVNTESDTWLAVREWADADMKKTLELLESPDTNERATQFLRGRIAAVKTLLALPNQRPTPKVTSDPYV